MLDHLFDGGRFVEARNHGDGYFLPLHEVIITEAELKQKRSQSQFTQGAAEVRVVPRIHDGDEGQEQGPPRHPGTWAFGIEYTLVVICLLVLFMVWVRTK